MAISPLITDAGVAPSLLAEIEATCNELAAALHPVSTKIHDNPELAWEEKIAHDTCTAFMEKQQGWKVTRHAYGLPTAWSAVFDNGPGQVVGFNSEMDALRSVGHACGHNLIAVLGMAAAISTAEAMKKHNIPGKVVLLGTPAEESGGGKTFMVRRGAYDEMDVCFMSHPAGSGGKGPSGYGTTIAQLCCAAGFSVKYTGASAHAAAFPESGINALDAAVSAYQNVALLRQQIGDKHRIYCTIKGSEKWSVNVIAGESTMLFGVRTPTAQETYSIINRAINCFKAGAIATGCKYDIRRETLYFDTQQSTELAKCHEEVCRTLHPDDTYIPNQQMTAATDFGDVTYKLPALHPTYFLPDAAKGDQPHSDTFANWTNTPTSMKATMRSASEIAGVAMRSLLDKEWTKTVRSEWQKQMESVDGKNMAIALHKMMDEYEPGDMATMPSCCGHGEEDSL